MSSEFPSSISDLETGFESASEEELASQRCVRGLRAPGDWSSAAAKLVRRSVLSLSNKVKWQCHQCRASFDDKADLTAHVLSHRQPPLTSPSDANTVANPPTPPPPIACSECDEMFMFEFRLKAHMLSAHGPVKRKSRSVVVPREEQVQKVGLPPEEGQPKVPSSSESLIVIGKRTRVQETVVRSQHSTCLTISAAEALESMKEDVSKNQDAPPETVMAAGFQPYRCKTCGKQFQRHGHLTVHQRSHSGVRPYQCKSCGLSFSSNSALKNHQISHTGVKDYMCNICKNSFARKSYLKTHLATVHDGSRPHTCRVCLKSFKGQGHLTEHMRLHNQEKPFQCNFCPQAFVQRSHLTVHLRVHSGAKPYACKICLQRFAHSSAVKIHERQHSGARPFPCPRCSSRFSQLPHLKKHMKCIHGEDRLYQCEVCNQSFRKRVDLENHVASNCDQTQPSQTPADQKKLVRFPTPRKKGVPFFREFLSMFADKNSKKHEAKIRFCLSSSPLCVASSSDGSRQSHSGVRPYQCKSCGLSFSSNSALKNHQISHTGVKDYMCNICKNSFARKSYLKTHLATVHDGSRPHTCRVCLKSFKGQGHLTEHMRLHNQEKPFQCNFCPQAFVQRSHLTVHLRVHSGAKPYACKICLQRFAHSSAVKIHERQHSGARPFPCPRCSSRFSQLPHLKKHMKCIHGEDRLYQCEVCNQSFRKRVDLENHVASNCDQTQPSQTPADQKKLVRVMSEPKKPSKTKKKAMSASAKMHFTGDLLQDYRILVLRSSDEERCALAKCTKIPSVVLVRRLSVGSGLALGIWGN
ncbi:unnamed protein product [Cyprideis torosa]|uniref:Uncharacterized protein n=1 Tax=Cyprideis torosa TaxID=163714 RepID=A0A7R8W740_9CRUS|nr:unnamed protein product [Cyprideis torosa]CAG0881774.1 unnamed protein product [Cyprideis torosa]